MIDHCLPPPGNRQFWLQRRHKMIDHFPVACCHLAPFGAHETFTKRSVRSCRCDGVMKCPGGAWTNTTCRRGQALANPRHRRGADVVVALCVESSTN